MSVLEKILFCFKFFTLAIVIGLFRFTQILFVFPQTIRLPRHIRRPSTDVLDQSHKDHTNFHPKFRQLWRKFLALKYERDRHFP